MSRLLRTACSKNKGRDDEQLKSQFVPNPYQAAQAAFVVDADLSVVCVFCSPEVPTVFIGPVGLFLESEPLLF